MPLSITAFVVDAFDNVVLLIVELAETTFVSVEEEMTESVVVLFVIVEPVIVELLMFDNVTVLLFIFE